MKYTFPQEFLAKIGTKAVDTKQISDAEEQQLEAQVENQKLGSMWGKSGEIYYAVDSVAKTIPAGNYNILETPSGYYLQQTAVNTDELIRLPDEASDFVVEHIKEFWQLQSTFEAHNFLHKRGILLFGPQGGGKTSAIFQVSSYFVNDIKGVVLDISNPYAMQAGLKMIRQVEPKRPIMCVIEDIDELISWYGDKKLTAILDGQGNINGVLFLATTNFPERLPSRIINRPSRFDVVKYVGIPSEAARKTYLEHKLPDLEPTELARWVQSTADFTIPQIKEVIILVRGYMVPLDQAVARIAEHKKPKSSAQFERP